MLKKNKKFAVFKKIFFFLRENLPLLTHILKDEATRMVKQEAFYMKRSLVCFSLPFFFSFLILCFPSRNKDQENLTEALKHAASMISELRTSLLSPKNYYDLCEYFSIQIIYNHIRKKKKNVFKFRYACVWRASLPWKLFRWRKEEREIYCWILRNSSKSRKRITTLVSTNLCTFSLCTFSFPFLEFSPLFTARYLLITVGSVYIQSREESASSILRDLVEMVKGVQNPIRGLFLRNYLSHMTRDKLPDLGSDYEG